MKELKCVWKKVDGVAVELVEVCENFEKAFDLVAVLMRQDRKNGNKIAYAIY